jgi:hypothetical protein
VARALLKTSDDVQRLQALKARLESKWTELEGAQFKPSGMLSTATSGGQLAGVFAKILTGDDDEDGAQDEDAEMWDALKELTDTEETLLTKWHEVVVTNNKKLLERQNYAPPGAGDSKFLKSVPPVSDAIRYKPHPLEVRQHQEEEKKQRRRLESQSIEAEQRRLLEAEKTAQAKPPVDPDDPEAEEIAKLKRLQAFRTTKRQELFDSGIRDTKYSALKIEEGVVEGEADDGDEDDEAFERGPKDGSKDDIFAKVRRGGGDRSSERASDRANFHNSFPIASAPTNLHNSRWTPRGSRRAGSSRWPASTRARPGPSSRSS